MKVILDENSKEKAVHLRSYTTEKKSKEIKDFHTASERHVLVVEADMPYNDVLKIVKDSNKLRLAGNELTAKMIKRYSDLRSKDAYKNLLIEYGEARKNKDKKECRRIGKLLNEAQKSGGVTFNDCDRVMQGTKGNEPLSEKYGLYSVFTKVKAKSIWQGLEKILYSDGKSLHFSKYNELPALQSNTIAAGIKFEGTVNSEPIFGYYYNANVYKEGKNGKKCFKTESRCRMFGIKYKKNDNFQRREIEAMMEYIENPEIIDAEAVATYLKTGKCIDTYRPCFASLIVKKIRGRWRVFLHITLEGKPLAKCDDNGCLKLRGKGRIGIDIGTQTIAYTAKSDNGKMEVNLKNLAERGKSIKAREKKETKIQQAMDKSMRANNPDNYNEDGTVKKGRKHWFRSKRYRKLKEKCDDLRRKNAVNRKYAIQTDINYLRSLGDTVITEPNGIKEWQERTDDVQIGKDGKEEAIKRKNHGKAIQNRCPGLFQAELKRKFEMTGGNYLEVPKFTYRASQYDHTVDKFIKKSLDTRGFVLQDGKSKVQRDCYSSFILYCFDFLEGKIDKDKCDKEFDDFYKKQWECLYRIKAERVKVMNSGIKVA